MRNGLALLVLVAVVATAAAQVPSAGSAALSLAGELPQGLRPGASGTATAAVTLTADGFACVQAATLRLAILVDDAKAAEGVVLLADNATSIALPVGVVPPGQPATHAASANLSLLVARYADGGATSRFTLTATGASIEPERACTLDASALAAELTLETKLADVPAGDPAFHPEHEEHGGYAFDKVLKPGESFVWTATEPGRYPYHDHFQPDRKGVVRVLRVAEGVASPTIRVGAQGFSPADVAVKVGTTVTWVNEDGAVHTVSADEQHDAAGVTEPEDAAAQANATRAPEEKATPAPAALLAVVASVAVAALRRRS